MPRASSPTPRRWPRALKERGLDIVSGGTDNHLMLVDLRPEERRPASAPRQALDRADITCNKNGIPFDPEKPFVTSGVRLGTPAGTTRGFGQAEFREIGKLIAEVLDGLKVANSDEGNAAVEAAVKAKVLALTERFPLYPYLGQRQAGCAGAARHALARARGRDVRKSRAMDTECPQARSGGRINFPERPMDLLCTRPAGRQHRE